MAKAVKGADLRPGMEQATTRTITEVHLGAESVQVVWDDGTRQRLGITDAITVEG